MDRLWTWYDHIVEIKTKNPSLEPEVRLTPDYVFVMVTRHLTEGGLAQIKKTVSWREVKLAKFEIVGWTLDKCVEEIMLETKKTTLKVIK